MADAKQLQFGQRLRHIHQSRRDMARGYVVSTSHNGLIIARPRQEVAKFSYRGLFMCLLVLLLFKGFLFARIGTESYLEKVTLLQNGSTIDRIGAYVMKADPVTIRIAQMFVKPAG